MAGSPKAQVVADVALSCAAAAGAASSPARPTTAERLPKRAGSTPPSGASLPSPLALLKPVQLAFPLAKTEVAWGAADDAIAQKKAADERQNKMDDDLRKMLAMVQKLDQDLENERAARIQMSRDLEMERATRIQLQMDAQAWEQHYCEEQNAYEWQEEAVVQEPVASGHGRHDRAPHFHYGDAGGSGREDHFDDEQVGPPPAMSPPGYPSDAKDEEKTCEDIRYWYADGRGWRQAGKADPWHEPSAYWNSWWQDPSAAPGYGWQDPLMKADP